MTWAIATGIAIGAVVGGGSAALQHKDVLKGALMGGAVGGISGGVGGGFGGVAEGALTAGEAGSLMGSNLLPEAMQVPAGAVLPSDGIASATAGELGFSPAGSNVGQNFYDTTNFASTPARTGLDYLKSDPMSFLKDNKMSIGLAGLAGSMAPDANKAKGPDMGTIRPYTYSASLNPAYTGAGTPYFNQRYTAGTPYAAAEGGIMRLAAGGSAVSDYNKMLMSRAQDEYINSPQLSAFRSHFNDPINVVQPAPAIPLGAGNLTYNPVTRQYSSAAPAAPAPSAGVSTLSTPATGDNLVGGGAANGGLMGYAMGGGIGSYYPEPDDGQGGQHPQDTIMGAHPSVSMGPSYPMQGIKSEYASGGGIGDLGTYSDGGRLLKGPGDGVSDDIPAEIGGRQPARLADGEFVVPARIVSELGNGSTDAGAKQLYAMMDRVQSNRKKSIGKGNVAVNSRSHKYLPA